MADRSNFVFVLRSVRYFPEPSGSRLHGIGGSDKIAGEGEDELPIGRISGTGIVFEQRHIAVSLGFFTAHRFVSFGTSERLT